MAGATVTQSLGHVATDPLRNFKFHVAIHHPTLPSVVATAKMGFMSVSGLNVTTEVIPYRQGGYNTTTQKMPGQSDFSPITLSKGLIIGDLGALDWMQQLFTVVQGTGSGKAGQEFRANMDIMVLDHPVTSLVDGKIPVKAAYRVYNAWPTAVAFSDLDAGANAIVVTQMTLAHEGFQFKLAKTTGSESVSF
jgi:phage tail-like protein